MHDADEDRSVWEEQLRAYVYAFVPQELLASEFHNLQGYLDFYDIGMGNNASQLEKELGVEQIPVNERYYGLVRMFYHGKCSIGTNALCFLGFFWLESTTVYSGLL